MQKFLLLITALTVVLFSQAKTLTPQQALERVDADVVANGKRAAAAARISASPKLLHTTVASDGLRFMFSPTRQATDFLW